MTQARAVFFDRDGTLITDAGYPNNPNQVELIPEAIPALKKLQEQGFLLVVISNQSGIGRGMITPEEALLVHNRFLEVFIEQGIQFTAAYYCPHTPEEQCPCRKPSPEMLLQAQQEHDINLQHSYMIGDKRSDIEAGKRAGCKGILYQTPDQQKKLETNAEPDFISTNWDKIIDFVLTT